MNSTTLLSRCNFDVLYLFVLFVMTVVAPLSAFLRFKAEFFFQLLQSCDFIALQIMFWLSYSNLFKLCFDTF